MIGTMIKNRLEIEIIIMTGTMTGTMTEIRLEIEIIIDEETREVR